MPPGHWMSSEFVHRTRIKICGLTREADVDAAIDAGADAIGFVLYDKSPRHVSAERAAVLSRRLSPFVTPVLLLVNADGDLCRRALDAVPNTVLQFHGDETPAECATVARPFLRAVRMAPGVDLLDFARKFADAQALLVDAHVEGYGGGGQVFDWSLLPPPGQLGMPLVLSGGLSPDNVAEGIRQVRPWAVDVSSGVELSKGLKDAVLMRRFCEAVRQADAAIDEQGPRAHGCSQNNPKLMSAA
jgi:phosphoribosylanthranilate isomerase